ncbi:MAG: sulfotransferase [Parafilimonas sp.]
MFDFFLAVNLITHTFSLKKESPRFPTGKRILSALLILPFFFILIIVNRFFMLLDWIFFPGFRKMKIKKAAFLTGVPRSATTYLFNILAQDKEHFTCFKLWEILFAPSIIQKYILSGIFKTDRLIGRPLYHFSLLLDKIFLGRIAKLHEISFSKPEEDEMLLLYAFGSMYLTFFFPGVKAIDPHLFFDTELSAKKKKKLMLFYKCCVQRHVFFFDKKEEKFFLSKNPCFISKIVSIAETFPTAILIYMLRSPLKTIPSTISLNANIYSVFSGKKKENPLFAKTTEVIIQWYKITDDSIEKHWQNRSIVVPFKKITNQPEATIHTLYAFLKLKPGAKMNSLLKIEQGNCRTYQTNHKYNSKNDALEKEICLELNFILNGKYKNEI